MSKARRPPRVVVDTNLVLSALVFGAGTPGALRHATSTSKPATRLGGEALAQNSLVQSWPEIARLARKNGTAKPAQIDLDI